MRKLSGLVLFLFSCPASAQVFSAGVKGGVPLTDFFTITVQGQNPTTSRYIIGPTAELDLPLGLGVEVDALYRHMSYTESSPHPLGFGGEVSFKSGRWEFPLLLKYRFKVFRTARPFVDAGVAWDTLSGISQSVSQSISNGSPTVVKNNTTAGFVAGAGADIHLVIHIMPEIRYTRWGSAQVVDPNTLLKSNLNQAEFLLGITF